MDRAPAYFGIRRSGDEASVPERRSVILLSKIVPFGLPFGIVLASFGARSGANVLVQSLKARMKDGTVQT